MVTETCKSQDFANINRFVSILHSPKTKESYRWTLGKLYEWLWDEKIDPEFLNGDQFTSFLDTKPNWGARTRYQVYTSARSYLSWCYGENHPFVKDFRMRRPKRRRQRVLSPDQVASVLASFDTATPYGVRGLSIITMTLDTGLRESEICNLALSEIDFSERWLLTTVKGDRDGEGVFSKYTRSCLLSWLSVRKNLVQRVGRDPGTVFVNFNDPSKKMTPSGLRKWFARVGIKSHIGPFSPHDLRRTFATISTKAGAPSRLVQAAGRWSDIRMVTYYTPTLSAKDFDPYSPVEFVMSQRWGDQNYD